MGCGASNDPGQGPPSPIVVNVKPKKKADPMAPDLHEEEGKVLTYEDESCSAADHRGAPQQQQLAEDAPIDQAQLEAHAKGLETRQMTLKQVTDTEIGKAEQLVKERQADLAQASAGEGDVVAAAAALKHQQSELAQMHELQAQVLDGIEQELATVRARLLPKVNEREATEDVKFGKEKAPVIDTAFSSDSAEREEPSAEQAASAGMQSLTPRIAALTTEVSVPEVVIRNLASISNKPKCFNEMEFNQSPSADFLESLLNFLEAAAAFSAAKSTSDRVGFMFNRWDTDNDGLLGTADLQGALGADCTSSTAAALILEMGGDEKGLTREALIAYVKQHPDIEEALVLRAPEGGGLASQLAARPLVVMVLLEARGSLETLVRELDTFTPVAPLARKLERVFDVLDKDGNGALNHDEVAKISQECSGEAAAQMLKRLQGWMTQNAEQSESNKSKEGKDGFISREDFLQFAALHIPGVEEALTVRFYPSSC